ncbi:MAG: sigma-70 family RNA polymerase sigma factor [Fimbriimonadaceae bacterium]
MNCDPARWLEEHGDVLYRFALSRLRDRTLAEDVVQDALLGALKNAKDFEGRADVRTWLIGILRNKIADQMRKLGRTREEAIEQEFESGRWAAPPGEWHDPEGQLENEEFRQRLAECMSLLPESLADAFVLREVEGLEYEKVCDALGLTATNLSTRLYRARLLLRKCLEDNWFGEAVK